MSVTAANLTDGIRVDQATQKGSVYDVIHLVCNKPSNYASQILARVEKTHPEFTPKCPPLRINGKGRKTPVANASTLQKVALACLRQSRMSHKQKQQKMREMGLPQEELMRVYVEEETLDPIVTVFRALDPVKQFCCG